MPRRVRKGEERIKCSRCHRRVRVPHGWSPGAALRRHYWDFHTEFMRGETFTDGRDVIGNEATSVGSARW